MARALLGAAGAAIIVLAARSLWGDLPAPTASDLVRFLAGVALGLMFLAAAAAPHRAAALLRAPTLATPGGLAALALAAIALYVVFGLGTFSETARLLEELQAGKTPEQLVADFDRVTLLVNLTLNFVVFLAPALVWAAAAEGQGKEGALAWLGLRREGWRWSVAWSLMAVLLVFWFLVLTGLTAKLLGQGEVPNERAEAIARNLDLPSALLVALLTGIGEEVFFRGFLQRKVGNLGQALLFGLAHLNYLQWLEVAVTAALGYGWGRTRERTGNLVGPIVGHAAFNFTSITILLAKENGWLAMLPLPW